MPVGADKKMPLVMVDASGPLSTKVWVDGVEVENLISVNVSQTMNDPYPVVTLEFYADATYMGPSQVTYTKESPF